MKFKPTLIFYLGAGVFFFFFWLLIVFPYESLESRIITEIENQIGGRYKIKMKDIDVGLLGSVVFEDLQIFEKVGGENHLFLQTPELSLDFSPFALLSKKLNFDFYLEGQKKGEIEGWVKQKGKGVELELELDDFPISDLAFLRRQLTVSFQGELDGKIKIKFNSADLSQNKGTIDIDLEQFSMDPAKIPLDPQDSASVMEIPKIKLSGKKGSHIQAKLNKERFEVSSIALKGGDVDLDLKGRITLRRNSLARSRLSLQGAFKVSQNLSKALPLLSLLEPQKNQEGLYPLRMSGRVSDPKIRIGKFWVRR